MATTQPKKPSNWERRALGTALIIVICLACGSARAEEATLEFTLSANSIKSVNLADLRQTLPVHSIEIFDPHHRKRKRYRAFALTDVLRFGFGPSLSEQAYTEASFAALDGYTSVSNREQILEDGGFLAFEDLDMTGGWEPIGRHRADPGPFYIVWTGANQSTRNGFPWPWQLRNITLLAFEDQYPNVVPTKAPSGSRIYRGYETFKARCVRCHAMNGQGGKIGPDLNSPRNILAYRAAEVVRKFISNPAQFRHSRMPAHPDLNDASLDDLLDYLWHMRARSR